MVLVVLVKLGVVAGVAFATKQMGFWESPEHSVVLLENAREHLSPYAADLKDRICCWKCQEKCKEEFEPKPWRDSWIESWNDTIKKVFHFLNQMPNYYHRFSEDVQQAVTDLAKEKDQKQTTRSKVDKTSAKSN
ncbi:uncharacterized protein LOC108163377 [Drosophila miranda]|uniref:uncharacterized protein LOC108163377 n=1 Tax=Drosophila miranda TaxID=7229 RepID=UPI00143F3BE4|nr:uncharacterized protein LOC108163377 [Drosophila miranda]